MASDNTYGQKPMYYGSSKQPIYYGGSQKPVYYGGGAPYYGSGAYGGGYYYGSGGGTAAQDADSLVGAIALSRVLRVVSPRWISVFVFLLIGLVAAFAVYRISPTIYEAKSEFTMDMRRTTQTTGNGIGQMGEPDYGNSYEEIFNTDDPAFGGSGVANVGRIESEDVPWNGREDSIVVRVPPLAGLVFKRTAALPKKPAAKKSTAKATA